MLGRKRALSLCENSGRFLQKGQPLVGFRSDVSDFGCPNGCRFVHALCPGCQNRKKMPCFVGCEGGYLGKDPPGSGLQKRLDLSVTDPCPWCGLIKTGIDH